MMVVIRGNREGRHVVTKEVGRGLSWQVDIFDFRMRSEITVGEGSWKLENG